MGHCERYSLSVGEKGTARNLEKNGVAVPLFSQWNFLGNRFESQKKSSTLSSSCIKLTIKYFI